MNAELRSQLEALTFGSPQNYRNVVILPVFAGLNHSPDFITLVEAAAAGHVAVNEISQSGSVPELLVTSTSEQPVLLLDGEELSGAKQNRVLNTTILLREKSQTRIPVSCTESGRWAYNSPNFIPAEVIMEKDIRARKSRSVSTSLASGAKYSSDQGEVWAGISALHAKAQSSSPTSAMADAFKARTEDLNKSLGSFPCLPGQAGLFVFVNGQVAGFDIISKPEAYAQLHLKLLRSYLLHGLLEQERAAELDAEPAARGFLNELDEAKESKFQSVGYGWDMRLNGNRIAGSALMHEEQLIHGAFFRLAEDRGQDAMASLDSRRSRFRTH